jgi:hypothetical protein
MVQDAFSGGSNSAPPTLSAGIQEAERRGLEGHERDDGEWVDPKPIQLGAIREGFCTAADEEEFNVFSVVDPSRVRDGDTMTENFNRVYRRWSSVTEKVAEEVAEQLRQEGYEIDPDGQGQGQGQR